MNSDEILKKLEEQSGLGSLSFNKDGVISFIINDKYVTNIEKSDNDRFLTIYGKIGVLPRHDREACFMFLLDANMFGYRIGKASIGVHPDSEEIYLFKTYEISSLYFDSFFDGMKQFLKTQQDWTNKIANREYLSFVCHK